MAQEDEVDADAVEGSINRKAELIYPVMKQKIRKIERCYAMRLAEERELAGRFTIEFVISPHGDLIRVQARDMTLGDEELIKCIVGQVRALEFSRTRRWRGGEGELSLCI